MKRLEQKTITKKKVTPTLCSCDQVYIDGGSIFRVCQICNRSPNTMVPSAAHLERLTTVAMFLYRGGGG